jgi:hypothetical protein
MLKYGKLLPSIKNLALYLQTLTYGSGQIQAAIHPSIGSDASASLRDSRLLNGALGLVVKRHVDGLASTT